MEERQLSLSEVAHRMGKSERTIRRWIKAGKLKAYKPGRDYLIPESAIQELVERSEVYPKLQAPQPDFELEQERRGNMGNEALKAYFEIGSNFAKLFEDEFKSQVRNFSGTDASLEDYLAWMGRTSRVLLIVAEAATKHHLLSDMPISDASEVLLELARKMVRFAEGKLEEARGRRANDQAFWAIVEENMPLGIRLEKDLSSIA